MRQRFVGLAIAAFILALDQFAKYMVIYPIDLKARGSLEVLPFFNLTWVENYGVSLGMLTANSDFQRWMLVAATSVITAGVVIWLWLEKNKQDVIALGMVLGGAIGNIIDRVRFGHVVDFADLHFGDFRPFLVFNVADAAITFGVLLLLVRAFLAPGKPEKANENG
jgi:signal peptidase II